MTRHSRELRLLLILVLASPPLVVGQPSAPDAMPFRDPGLPIEERVFDLLGRLTLDEKVSLMIERAEPVERLGIPRFPWWNEALHGVARTGRATVFPRPSRWRRRGTPISCFASRPGSPTRPGR